MLIMGHPQFNTQDDVGFGDGIPCIPEWQLDVSALEDTSEFNNMQVDYAVWNVFIRLRNVLRRAQQIPFSSTQLHDLTCFVIHRLLLSTSTQDTSTTLSPITETLRYGIIIYMLVIQGPTYYSHAVIMNTMTTRFMDYFKELELAPRAYDSLDVWLITIGLFAATGTPQYEWFAKRAQLITASVQLGGLEEVLAHARSVLWLETSGEEVFRQSWAAIQLFDPGSAPDPLQFMPSLSPISTEAITESL